MIAIIKYNAGNTQSVAFALDRLGIHYKITDNTEEILSAEKVIFPGVGEASTAMKYLQDKNLDQLLPQLKQPVLGICLGMQLMCRFSEENSTKCLDIFDLTVKRFEATQTAKVPHTGWNNLTQTKGWLGPQFENTFVYFVHSYYVPVNPYTVAQTDYIVPFSAAMEKDNFFAAQFHPEKSAEVGEMVIKQFLKIKK
ncbi:MAG TPA: imidazole glycerol phosphate synthase subunit HisH [Cytophagales bacterium]|nr:imidazole glycerol phosphate synthase subunit HisH [Cytophagales bacterium]HCR54040.1 imidazole glycerol phosphate synthase subunit HisH [Cytophagales bacterium]